MYAFTMYNILLYMTLYVYCIYMYVYMHVQCMGCHARQKNGMLVGVVSALMFLVSRSIKILPKIIPGGTRTHNL